MAFLKALAIVEVENDPDLSRYADALRGGGVRILGASADEGPESLEIVKVSAQTGGRWKGTLHRGWWILTRSTLDSTSERPIRLLNRDTMLGGIPSGRALWLFRGRTYLTADLDLTPDDVRALVNQDENKRRLALEKAHALEAMAKQLDKPRVRERLPQEVKVEVWRRDQGRCAECESQESLEFDHIIPFAMGGSNTARNIQLLCADCNRRKGMTLG